MSTPVGIKACGAYLPRSRLERAAIAAATGWASGMRGGKAAGRRSVGNWDEDALTMAVEAARDCLTGVDRASLGALAFASTTFPFDDRSNSGVVASALDLAETVRSADAAGTQRAGTTALGDMLARARAGDGDALLVASDRRRTRPASAQEIAYGDGAAALLLGQGPGVLAEFIAGDSITADFVDHHRSSGEDYDYALEDRWVRDEGYLKLVPRAVAAGLARAGLAAGAVTHFVLQGPKRHAAAAARACGVAATAVVDDLAAGCGDTGAAHPLLLLAGVLERAAVGDVVLVAGFGQGCDVLLFRVAGKAPRTPVAAALVAGVEDREYVRFLSNQGVLDVDFGMRAERDNRTSQSAAWRRHRDVTAFVGGRCRACGTVQFPKMPGCVNPECRALHTQDDHPLADAEGRVKTYTEDWLAYTRSPPLVYGNVAFEGGGNVFIEFADTPAGTLEVGAPTRFVFRIKDFDRLRGFRRYAWKAAPART